MEYLYAALLLHKLEQPVNEENLTKVISATGAQVDDAKLKTLIASLQGVDIAAELEKGAAVAAAPAAAAPAAKEKKEEKKEEEKPSESAAGLSALFG